MDYALVGAYRSLADRRPSKDSDPVSALSVSPPSPLNLSFGSFERLERIARFMVEGDAGRAGS
jgi:hypothetical protein